ncbi:Ribonuclease P subunit p14 [Paramuricea clavata]|uniref:Ribonuclease P subunit p14 n=1 Tax=Paramuricea clavata TaxID=317549 RepID=A0A7D9IGW2_PARCT|nr:Ribonuclease P subunit p14 [Paramuricea clavata]
MSSRVTAKQKSEYYYLKCVLEQEENGTIKYIVLERVKLKSLIVNALKQLHGLVGAAITVDVLKCEKTSGEIILRVKSSDLIKLRSSLTILNNYNGTPCRCNVKQVKHVHS